MSGSLPQRVLAWYGDDFTGSTDALEMLALNGFQSVLFLAQPSEGWLERFQDYRAFGLAGSSRSRSPEWMDEHLPSAFEWLARIRAPVCHYKVCSTFDSSPHTGNIGRALEIGQRILGTPLVPIVAGAPALRRFTMFGNLFAAAGNGQVYRIDRHPTMSRHPVTSMNEADLRIHLARQTQKQIGLISHLDLASPALTMPACDAVLIDVLDEATLCAAGDLLWREARQRQLFVVGSSGVEHALATYWKSSGRHQPPGTQPALEPVDRIVVLSGSCSPVTAGQIADAEDHGFALIRLDALALASGDGAGSSMDRSIADAVLALQQGRSVVLYSAAGPRDQLPPGLADRPGFRESLGRLSGCVLAAVLDRNSVRRIVVAGGDTSSHAGGLLGVQALTFLCPLAPGAPLCRAWSDDAHRDGLEIVFKGGQCGDQNFFSQVRGSLS